MSDQRCIGKTCTDGPLDTPDSPILRPRWATRGLLCTRCADRLERHLAEMPARRDLLRTVLASGGTASGGNKPTKGEPPSPMRDDVHDLLVALQATLTSWARLIAEERDLTDPTDLRALSLWLLAQHAWALQQPWVDDFADEMHDIAKQADRLTAHRARWNRLPAPCPDCDAHELGRWDGHDDVQCGSCEQTLSGYAYQRLIVLGVTDLTVTAAQAAARLEVPRATFRGWAATGRVRPLGKVDGLHRYDIRDIDALQHQETA